ncbi:hybrid sensor histidine kinase/response regulator [Massilia sp. PAMC28688]|uniref:hybrid sensor histidine kinase/response regulator n=1 Tax=Massilia sp. PAMC28688 TaxID=2861283 RepID=UPI001C635089|nr:hybrid sensor histidine kinase/response regulator [Massilia sp. PAMC28688]QYF93941.1 hybrid sensor histidine kinase/response regulator [Massilia sp. PAMC28688]
MSHDADDLSQFSMMDLFRMEAEGQSQQLTDGLLALERKSGSNGTVESLMRAAHSIKGAAAIVGLDVVVQLAHAMEDVFVAAQNGLLLTPANIDTLLADVDIIMQISAQTEGGVAGWLAANGARIGELAAATGAIRDGEAAAAVPAPAAVVAAPAAAPQPASLATLLAQDPDEEAREIAAAMAAMAQLEQERAPAPAPATGAPDDSGEPPPAPGPARGPAQAQNFDRLLALASESRINAHQMQPFIASLQRFKRNQGLLFQALEQLNEAVLASGDAGLIDKAMTAVQKAHPLKQFMLEHLADIESYERRLLVVSDNLVDEVLALRMRPFRDGVQAFPRMVRDLARSLGKQAQLVISGEDTLVDRDILARIESPLNHILRNAVDHGVDSPDERRAAGKPALATITLDARHRAGMLSIEISDDGRGVDLEQIRRKVVERKMASEAMAASLSAPELMEFLFLPAFSLKETTSAISGRGVGLDIVHQAIREQNGSVRMQSEPGHGLRTSITLPLTQSVVRSLVVDIQGEAYAVPIVKVERVLMVPQAEIHTLENKQFFDYGGEHLGLVSAAQVLELGQMAGAATDLPVLVIGSAQRRFALVVDAIRGEQSLAVQALDRMFGKIQDVSSAALLDDGSPVLILDVADLLVSIDKLLGEGSLHQLARENASERQKVKRVLVVDDSLTVREMERKLLQARGYRVDIAIDGIDGWNVVRSGEYDLVITDVDMPRMDGIELVALIKKDVHLHQLPVMIVSYKDRPEDRARGMAAGADYYLTKGSFHDETLLDAVFELIGDAAT